jgi:hypothetical protein
MPSIGVRMEHVGYAAAYPKNRAFFLKIQKINKNYDKCRKLYWKRIFVIFVLSFMDSHVTSHTGNNT